MIDRWPATLPAPAWLPSGTSDSGDGNYAGSTMQYIETVQTAPPVVPDPTTTTVPSAETAAYGNITLNAVVKSSDGATSPSGNPTGRVEFYDGDNDLGGAALDSDGNASLITCYLAIGEYDAIRAVYGGDLYFTGQLQHVSVWIGARDRCGILRRRELRCQHVNRRENAGDHAQLER